MTKQQAVDIARAYQKKLIPHEELYEALTVLTEAVIQDLTYEEVHNKTIRRLKQMKGWE